MVGGPQHVLALGGSGLVGRYALRTLRRLRPEVAVTLADRDITAARAFADELGGEVECVQLDVTHGDQLRATLEGAPLVMNTVGPYFRFGLPILRAALEAGCDYLDVCDDPEPTLAMLELDGLARERGATAVLGLGMSPGVTNLLAVHAISLLSEARELITGWDLDSAKPEVVGPEPSAAILHGIEQLTGTIRVRRRGVFVDEAPVRATRVDYPGAASCRCYTIGHPEPITLPRTFPELAESVNVMSTDWRTAMAIRLLGKLVDRGLLTPRTAASWAERVEGPSTGDIDAEVALRELASGRRDVPPVFALARGTLDGRAARVGVTLSATPPGGMGGATGLPLGVGASLFLRGLVGRPGVHAPEALIPLEPFFTALAALCEPPGDSMESLLVVSRA
ncbi:MAG: saccharopine dehydrogenase [Deltaproteobacteria bacterium]|nr:saccharopine dehydrogenase [Deltaproteobacteria bacterium]